MIEKKRLPGKYLRLVKDDGNEFYLPLERCSEIAYLRAGGYVVAEEGRVLLKVAEAIEKADRRRSWSEELRRRYLSEMFADFSRDSGDVHLLCPYCLGRVSCEEPGEQSEMLCGWYDRAMSDCDGTASYRIDRANLMLGSGEVELYTCNVRGGHLDLAARDIDFFREETGKRAELLRMAAMGGIVSEMDMLFALLFPLRVSVTRTDAAFKEYLFGLSEGAGIDWFSTISLGELTSLLEKSATM